MYLHGENNYQLHELEVAFVGDPQATVWLVDDTNGQVLSIGGKLRQIELTNTWLWDMPSMLDEFRLEPSVRDVTASLLMTSNALTLELNDVHSHYRRLNVYESWMEPFDRFSDPGNVPSFFSMRGLKANLRHRQIQLELTQDEDKQSFDLGRIASLDMTTDARNDDFFVNEVRRRPLRQDVKISLEEVARGLGVHGTSFRRRLEALQELWLAGPNLNVSIVSES